MTRIARVPLLTFALLLAGFGLPAMAAAEAEKVDGHTAAGKTDNAAATGAVASAASKASVNSSGNRAVIGAS